MATKWLGAAAAGITAFAVVGAGVVLIQRFGGSILWSEKGAAWASAIATSLAVLVALYVGIAPHRATQADHQRRARSIGLFVYGRIARQVTTLEAARQLCGDASVDVFLFNVIRANLRVDPRCADQLVPYFDALPEHVAESVAAAVAQMEKDLPSLSTFDAPGFEQLQADRLKEILGPLCSAMDAAQSELGGFAKGKPVPSIGDAASVVANGLRFMAVSSREIRTGL